MAKTVSRDTRYEIRDTKNGKRIAVNVLRNTTLNICHLYADIMDTYGDRGNILALKYRCKERGINVNVDQITIGQNLKPNIYDLYFFGGGQDKIQELVGTDLKTKAETIKADIEKGAVMLSVCGGYQLLQKYFKTTDGTKIPGISLFNAYTVASQNRMMDNLLIEINPKIAKEINTVYKIPNTKYQLVGFENHSGKTYLEEGTMPLGTVIRGSGNNGEDKLEGAVYKNAFGCYLHGSLLPKNPHFADLLISKALERKYGKIKMEPLDDSIEWQAHNIAVNITKGI